MLDVAERVAANEQAASQINLNEKQMTLSHISLTISRDVLANKQQSAVSETVSKELTDLPNAAVSKTDTQRDCNAVSTPCPEEHHPWQPHTQLWLAIQAVFGQSTGNRQDGENA